MPLRKHLVLAAGAALLSGAAAAQPVFEPAPDAAVISVAGAPMIIEVSVLSARKAHNDTDDRLLLDLVAQMRADGVPVGADRLPKGQVGPIPSARAAVASALRRNYDSVQLDAASDVNVEPNATSALFVGRNLTYRAAKTVDVAHGALTTLATSKTLRLGLAGTVSVRPMPEGDNELKFELEYTSPKATGSAGAGGAEPVFYADKFDGMGTLREGQPIVRTEWQKPDDKEPAGVLRVLVIQLRGAPSRV